MIIKRHIATLFIVLSSCGCYCRNTNTPLLRRREEIAEILDISGGYARAASYNNNSIAHDLIQLAKGKADITALVGLDHGEIVAEYYDIIFNSKHRFPLWSGTKTWTGVLFGVMRKDGLITVNETLWDVWPNETLWSMVDDAEYRKSITIKSLLQMRSGLKMPPNWLTNDILPIRGGKLGGKDFFDSLTYHSLDPEDMGHYNYINANNIPSYIIQTKTGMTPEQYALQKVWPRLGISSEDHKWYNNTEGVTLGFHGLYLTTHAYLKLGMLYLQNGMASENEQVVEQSWVERSLQAGDEQARPFGYLWWIDSYGGNLVYCSKGMGGQRMCFNKETQRVIVIFGHDLNHVESEGGQGEKIHPQKELIDMFFQANDSALGRAEASVRASSGRIHHHHVFVVLLATLACALAS